MIERYKTLQMDYAFYRGDSLQNVTVKNKYVKIKIDR